MEAWDDGAAAFNDWESPYCLAHRLCRASFAGFDSGRALLAGGVMGVGGGSGEGARRPDGDTWWPSVLACSGTWTRSGVAAPVASAIDECLLPARPSSHRSAYG